MISVPPPRRGHRLPGPLLLLVVLALAGRAGAEIEPRPRKTLAECIEIAFENQPTLKSATASVLAADQRVWQAASNYLPQISANYLAQRQQTSISASTQTGFANQSRTSDFYSTSLAFSQILFDFGQTLDQIRAAQATRRSADANLTTQREVVVFDVKQSYYNLLAATHLLDVADETVRDTKKQLEQAEGRHQVGLAPRFDVTRAQVQVANAELNQVTARNAVAVSRETLRNALGLDDPLGFDLVDTLARTEVQVDDNDAVGRAYANRPELQSIVAQQEALEEQIASLQKNYLPFVTGNGHYEWTGPNYPLQPGWLIGANVNLSIFNGGFTTAQIGEAKANLDVLRYNEKSLRQSIALQVRQSALDLERARESIRVAGKGVQQARESLDLAEGRYSTGVGNIIELTDAQTSFTSAQASFVQAQYGYQISLAALERAIGAPAQAEGP